MSLALIWRQSDFIIWSYSYPWFACKKYHVSKMNMQYFNNVSYIVCSMKFTILNKAIFFSSVSCKSLLELLQVMEESCWEDEGRKERGKIMKIWGKWLTNMNLAKRDLSKKNLQSCKTFFIWSITPDFSCFS